MVGPVVSGGIVGDGVMLGVGVLVGVLAGVGVLVDLAAGVGVFVSAGVLVGASVGVDVPLGVTVNICVPVGAAVGIGALVSMAVGIGVDLGRGQKCRIPNPPSARSRTDTRAMAPLIRSGIPETVGPAGAGAEGG